MNFRGRVIAPFFLLFAGQGRSEGATYLTLKNYILEERIWQSKFVTESMPVISVFWQAIRRWRRLRNSPNIQSSSVLTVAGLLIPKRICVIPCPSSKVHVLG
jgi:hypothetical protein